MIGAFVVPSARHHYRNMSRSIKDLSFDAMSKVILWEERMKAAGVEYIITCTRRTAEEQKALYAQGRTTPGKIVTWTLNSNHLTGKAFDFVVMFNGKPDWKMEHKDMWDKAIEIGKELGFSQVIGKNGKVKEYAHLQLVGEN